MPGVNLIFSWGKDVQDWSNLFSKTHHQVRHNDHYSEQIIVSDDYCIMGCTKYETYPLSSFDFHHYKIVIDGIVYNKDASTIRSELFGIASLIDSDNIARRIEEWTLSSDGEYNVLFYDSERQNMFLFNDPLGRLPLYYYSDDRIVVLSREINFVTPFLNEIVFDKEVLEEYLLFSAPLGDSTLISNIKRLNPGMLMEVRGGDKGKLRFSQTHVFNLDKKKNAGKSVRDNAAELKNLFLDGCKNRHQSLKHLNTVVSLSGGLDSRSVAVGLKTVGASFSAATFTDGATPTYVAAVEIAKTIAGKLQVPWKLFQLQKAGIREVERILQYKGGLNTLSMPRFMPSFLGDIQKEYGHDISYWTGDEGNASMADISPPRRLRNTDALVDFILNVLGRGDGLEGYLDIDMQKLKAKLKGIVEQYPEKNSNEKFLHFFFFQNLFRLQYEGEDRNRVFFWSVAPLYSLPFFTYALNVPSSQKKYHDLYREFLTALSPEIASIRNENWGYAITSRRKIVLRVIKTMLSHKVPLALRNRIKQRVSTKKRTFPIDPELKVYFTNIVRTSPTASKIFSRSGLESVSHDALTVLEWNLLTILALISKTEKELKDKTITVR
jgi:asparagine synthase (glutamine-hydrolysing)